MKENQLTLKNGNLTSLMRNVQERIISVRGMNVILDADVASLYGVETRRINDVLYQRFFE